MHLNGRIWVETDKGKLLGPGRIELLQRIQQCGSLRQAALQMEMSYKKAWDLISDMNTQFSDPLVISNRGGKGGGKAVVTAKGEFVIQRYGELRAQFEQFLKQTPVNITL
jgi:molybdate transport system regulatory protein